MRHLKSGRALGVKPAHRRAMMRNIVTSLLEHEQITTTVARAKELRKPLDQMVTLGKKGDLSARRRALRFVKSKKAMQALFGELPERYADRAGGYTRIIRLGFRKGDGAELALVQMVDAPNDALAHAEKPKTRRGGAAKGKTAAKEVAEQVKGKAEPRKKKAKDKGTEKAAEAAKETDEDAEKGKGKGGKSAKDSGEKQAEAKKGDAAEQDGETVAEADKEEEKS